MGYLVYETPLLNETLFYATVLAVHCCLALVYAVPLPERDALTRAAERGLSLAKKILNDIPLVHDACVKTTVRLLTA